MAMDGMDVHTPGIARVVLMGKMGGNVEDGYTSMIPLRFKYFWFHSSVVFPEYCLEPRCISKLSVYIRHSTN